MKKVWLVGGVLRDLLLKLWGRSRSAPKDIDLVVEGATTGEMGQAYGAPTGNSFPVWRAGQFELALPRRERKVAPGYRGFQVEVGGVPLVEELGRRDFTVNSLAYFVGEFAGLPAAATLEAAVEAAIRGFDPGRVYDPFGGMGDLREGVLRAAYPAAFQEDPVRVLRAARFAARYSWRVDPATLQAARAAARELAFEPAERIWGEWEKATAHSPSQFLEVLLQAGAPRYIRGLQWLAEATPQPNHLETLPEHVTLVLRAGESLGLRGVSPFTALLFHDRGKVKVGEVQGPHDGEAAATAAAADLALVKAPSQVVKFTTTWLRAHMAFWGLRRPGRIVEMAQSLARAGITPALAGQLALADSQGKLQARPLAEARARVEQQVGRLEAALEAIEEVRGDDPRVAALPPGPKRGEALLALRANALARKPA